jgi:transposase
VDAVLRLLRTAAAWRDLPPALGKRTGVPARVRRWAMAGVRGRLFLALRADPSVEDALIHSAIGKAEADATGARRAQAQGIGRARGGLARGMQAAVSALGLPVQRIPTPGQAGDCPQAAALIDGREGRGQVIAAAACDPNALHGRIETERAAEDHVQANPSRAIRLPPDPDLSAGRHKVRTVFQRVKRLCRIAPGCGKPLASVTGFVLTISALDRPG